MWEEEQICDVCQSARAVLYCHADKAALCRQCDQEVHSANALSQRHHRVPLAAQAERPAAEAGPASTHHKRARLTSAPSLASETSQDSESSGDSGEGPRTDVHQGRPLHIDENRPSNLLATARSIDSARMETMMAEMANLEDSLGFNLLAGCGDLKMELPDMSCLRGSGSSCLLASSSGEGGFCSKSGQAVKLEPGGWSKGELAEMLPQGAHSKSSLRLNISDVMTAWVDREDVWSPNKRPQIVPEVRSTDAVLADEGVVPSVIGVKAVEDSGSLEGDRDSEGAVVIGVSDQGLTISREARLERYKEKRRNRQFSKKIRYEVRKLNAERRPRVKGRFVKREQLPQMMPMPLPMPMMLPTMMGYYMY